MINKKYGEGEILLVKNYICGAGKSVKYCSLEEAKKLDIRHLDLTGIYKELAPFIFIPSPQTLNKWIK